MPPKLPNNTLHLFPATAETLVTVPGNPASRLWSPRLQREKRILKRRSQYYCRIDASALAGIFVVFIFFFSVVPIYMYSRHGISVDLPKTAHFSLLPGALREDAMRLGITRDGRLYLGSHQASPDQLRHMIREALRTGAENRVYISADARAKYLDVKVALDAIRLAGVEHITFLAESQRR